MACNCGYSGTNDRESGRQVIWKTESRTVQVGNEQKTEDVPVVDYVEVTYDVICGRCGAVQESGKKKRA